MKTILNKLALAALAGTLIAPAVEAQTSVTFVGGNATQKIIQDRVVNAVLQPGSTLLTTANAQIFSYLGYLQSDGSYVQLNFNLTGGAGGISDLYSQTAVTIYGGTAVPNAAVSITGPGTIGFSATQITNLTQLTTLGAPVVFAINTNLPNSFSNVWSLTSRQAQVLETESGVQGPFTLTTSALGGSSTTDPVYFFGRNDLAAVRQVTDANIYFYFPEVYGLPAPTFVTWTTNGSGQPVIDGSPNPGSSSGTQVGALLNTISNAVGTLAIGDVQSSFKILALDGVPFSVTNVENGSYENWGVERYLYGAPGNSAGIPTPTGVTLESITNLVDAVKNSSFESTSPLFVNLYVPLSGLNSGADNISGVNNGGVSRPLDYDGLTIQPSPYNTPY